MSAMITITVGGVEVVRHALTDGVTIGRAEDADIRLTDMSVSRKHCRIEPTETGWRVQDLGSLNGVLVRGVRLHEHPLRPGDAFVIGSFEIEFSEEAAVVIQEGHTVMRAHRGLAREHPVAAHAQALAIAGLGPRLKEVFDALLTGKSRKEIAAELGLSPHTVFGYVKDIYQAMGVRSRPELMARFGGQGSDIPKPPVV